MDSRCGDLGSTAYFACRSVVDEVPPGGPPLPSVAPAVGEASSFGRLAVMNDDSSADAFLAAVDATWLAPGVTLAGRYELLRVVGRGGMGVVIEAYDRRLNRPVAVKMMASAAASSGKAIARFEREAQTVARLRSPHVVRLFDVDIEPPLRPFLIMEMLEGRGLDAELSERGVLPAAEAIAWLLEACDAMSEAHAAGVVHRDLKPSNLFLCCDRGRRTLKVLDFGISKLIDDRTTELTEGCFLLGTPLYMAPEQILGVGSADPRSDIWSLGVVLYELLTGKAPFARPRTAAVLAAIVSEPPPPLHRWPARHDVPVELERVLWRALRKDPEERFATVSEFAEALRSVPIAPPMATRAPRSRTVRPSYPAVRLAVTAVALILAAAACLRRCPWAGVGEGVTKGGSVALVSEPASSPTMAPLPRLVDASSDARFAEPEPPTTELLAPRPSAGASGASPQGPPTARVRRAVRAATPAIGASDQSAGSLARQAKVWPRHGDDENEPDLDAKAPPHEPGRAPPEPDGNPARL